MKLSKSQVNALRVLRDEGPTHKLPTSVTNALFAGNLINIHSSIKGSWVWSLTEQGLQTLQNLEAK